MAKYWFSSHGSWSFNVSKIYWGWKRIKLDYSKYQRRFQMGTKPCAPESWSAELQWSAQSRPISPGTRTCWYHGACGSFFIVSILTANVFHDRNSSNNCSIEVYKTNRQFRNRLSDLKKWTKKIAIVKFLMRVKNQSGQFQLNGWINFSMHSTSEMEKV